MARILFVNQYYWPDFASTGQHLTDLCEHLARRGHDVRVVCSRGRYLEGKGDAPLRETRGGVSIRRVRATSFGKRRHLGRLVDYLSFHALAGLRVAFSRRADVVVTLTTPPLIGWCGTVARLLGGSKHINFLMDLHPDAEFESGMVRRGSLAGRLLERVAATILRRADRNVVLGLYQGRRVLERGVDPTRVAEIPVWSDGAEIAPVPHADNALRAERGWSESFVVMYSGNAGLVHGFDELLDAAAELDRTDPDVRVVFAGGGPRTPEIRAEVERRGLTNVSFHDYVDRSELAQLLSAADVHFLSLLPRHVGVAVPGKLYGILAAGRPALFVGSSRSETAETIVSAGAGSVFAPGEGHALAEEIRALARDPARREEQGRSGREYFLRYHERAICVEAWRDLLESVAGESSAARAASEPSDLPAVELERTAPALPTPRPSTRETGKPRVLR